MGAGLTSGGRVEQSLSPEAESSPDDRIRALGFEPSNLTPAEQEELLEIHSLWPDEAIGA